MLPLCTPGPDWNGNRSEVLRLSESDLDESDDSYSEVESEEKGLFNDRVERDEIRKVKPYKRLQKERIASQSPLLSDDEVSLSVSDEEDYLSRWGSNKRAYYNNNELSEMDSDSEIDAEQARELELKELKTLLAKARRGMEDSDFGLGEADEIGGAEEGGKGVKEQEKRRRELDKDETETFSIAGPSSSSTAVTLQSQSQLPTDAVARASLLVQLHKESPETIALAGDFADAVAQLIETENHLKEAEKHNFQHEGLGMHHLHYQTLYTYVTTLTYYFHLRSSPKYSADPKSLSQHPILKRLLKLKEGLSTMEELGFAVPTEEKRLEDDEEIEAELDDSDDVVKHRWSIVHESEDEKGELGELEPDELDGLLADEKENSSLEAGREKASSESSPSALNGQASKDGVATKTKKRKRSVDESQEARAPPPLAVLANEENGISLDLVSHGSKRPRPPSELGNILASGEMLGEAASLSSVELAQKAAKKKSLRFYTGRMDAKEAKRGQAARDRIGGDEDIPYRDRSRSRLAVEQARAVKERKATSFPVSDGGAALDNANWGVADTRDWRSVMGVGLQGGDDQIGQGRKNQSAGADDDDDDDDYYDLVTTLRQEAKRAKKKEHDLARDKARIIDDAEVEPGSHRVVNRQISTNRGLTPHRKQDRNLRVRKRKKYEKAQKKLSSTRAVYKGGQAALQGGYQGESSGINAGISKSRKFAN